VISYERLSLTVIESNADRAWALWDAAVAQRDDPNGQKVPTFLDETMVAPRDLGLLMLREAACS
jgi:hypothetical protein